MNGVRCTFQCAQGYFMSAGDAARVCYSNGTWSGAGPVCTILPPIIAPQTLEVYEVSGHPILHSRIRVIRPDAHVSRPCSFARECSGRRQLWIRLCLRDLRGIFGVGSFIIFAFFGLLCAKRHTEGE